MVRVKKRYLVLRLERREDVEREFVQEINKKGPKRRRCRALDCGAPLRLSQSEDSDCAAVAEAARAAVQALHGDHGRAAVTVGLRAVYCNRRTGAAVLCCRHGPHRLLASALPFLTRIRDEDVVPTLVYTGATVRNCYKVRCQTVLIEHDACLQREKYYNSANVFPFSAPERIPASRAPSRPPRAGGPGRVGGGGEEGDGGEDGGALGGQGGGAKDDEQSVNLETWRGL